MAASNVARKAQYKKAGPAWRSPLLWAVGLVGVSVGLLVAVRPPQSGSPGPTTHETRGQIVGSAKTASPRTPRDALPADAWAILDLDLAELAGIDTKMPELLEQLDCRQVEPPRRIGMALLSPGRHVPDQDPFDFQVAATETSPSFRACARRKMLEADAHSEPWPGGYEVIARPGGLRLILQEQQQLAVFVNAPSLQTADILEVLAGTRPSAAEQSHHAVLHDSLQASAGALLTLALPDGWMDHLVEPDEAARSPLRFLRAAAWALEPNSLSGVIDCRATADGSGCRTLARFIEAARDTVLGSLSLEEQAELFADFSLEEDVEKPTRLRLRWTLPPEARSRVLGKLWAQFR